MALVSNDLLARPRDPGMPLPPDALGNPLLHEIDQAHAALSAPAKQVISQFGAASGGMNPLSAPSPATSLIRPPVAPVRPLGAAPNPTLNAAQNEVARLTIPNFENNPNTGKSEHLSGIQQIKSPWARIPLSIAEGIGTALFPRAMAVTPGTQLHHQMLVRNAMGAEKQQEAQLDEPVKRELEQSQTAHNYAAANNLEGEAAGREFDQQYKQAQIDKMRQKGYVEVDNVTGEDGTPHVAFVNPHDPSDIVWGPAQASKPTKPDLDTMIADLAQQDIKAGKDPNQNPTIKQLQAIAQAGGKQATPNSKDEYIGLLAKQNRGEKLTPEEQARLNAIRTATVEPGVARAQVFVNGRVLPTVDTGTGQVGYTSAGDIRKAPGQYAPPGPAQKAATAQSVFSDLYYNINTTKAAIQSMPELDAPTRAALAYVLDTHDEGALRTFLQGEAVSSLSPASQEFIRSMAQLNENAMTLRSIGGMGQGSDELRAAIRATLPGAKSANKQYMMDQMNKFESVVSRLHSGALKAGKLGMSGETGGNEAPPPEAPIRVRRKSDGATGTINPGDFDASKYEKVK